MTTYEITGLNFVKFLGEIERRNILLAEVIKLSHNKFCVKVNTSQKKKFLNLCSQLNLDVLEKQIPFFERLLRGIKSHIPLCFFATICMVLVIISQMFVFRIEVFGESSISESEIISVLKSHGFGSWKPKGNYKTEEVEKILTSNISGISFASAVIHGGTLVVNVYEKIDTSQVLDVGEPIISPCDLIVQNVDCTSGTVIKGKDSTAKAGEVIVGNYVMLENTKIDVPAHANIVANIQHSISKLVVCENIDEHAKKVVEENKKMMYNILSKTKILNEIEENTEILKTEKGYLIISKFSGQIEFSS